MVRRMPGLLLMGCTLWASGEDPRGLRFIGFRVIGFRVSRV